MTKEQAKQWIYRKFNSGEAERLMADLIIKALKQEPCEDAISRQYLIEKATNWEKHFHDSERYVSLTDIQNAPPVKPQPKIGHWIEHEIEDTCRWLTCSVCGHEWVNKKENFCPNCGAKMESEG